MWSSGFKAATQATLNTTRTWESAWHLRVATGRRCGLSPEHRRQISRIGLTNPFAKGTSGNRCRHQGFHEGGLTNSWAPRCANWMANLTFWAPNCYLEMPSCHPLLYCVFPARQDAPGPVDSAKKPFSEHLTKHQGLMATSRSDAPTTLDPTMLACQKLAGSQTEPASACPDCASR